MPDVVPPDDDLEPGSGAIAAQWFPAGPAEGSAYLARHDEYQRLLDDTLHGRSRWFDCPARYGVGTIVRRVRHSLKHNYEPRMNSTTLSLRGVHDADAFASVLLTAFGRLAARVIRHHAVQEQLIAPLFPGTPKEIYIDEKYLQTIRFLPRDNAFEALVRLAGQIEALSEAQQCRSLLVAWDSEQIASLRDQQDFAGLLARLLNAMPRTSWVFHGNNRAAMRRFFGAKDGPLHGRCLRFALRPIDAAIYRAYLTDAAQARWRCFIGVKATNMMLALTRRHPYWMNALCRRLWCRDVPPLIQNVVHEWEYMAAYYHYQFAREIEHLSPNQRSVLLALAQTPTTQPRAKRFVARTRVSSASVGQAIKILGERDLIGTDNDGAWHITDPLMQWALHPQRELVSAIYEGRPWPI